MRRGLGAPWVLRHCWLRCGAAAVKRALIRHQHSCSCLKLLGKTAGKLDPDRMGFAVLLLGVIICSLRWCKLTAIVMYRFASFLLSCQHPGRWRQI